MASCGTIRTLPGPPGAAGANGAAGAAGDNSWTTLSAAMTMPAEGADVTASVADSDMFTSGQTVYVQGAGFMEVQSVPSSVQVVLRNLENTANNAYLANVVAGTVIASGNKIVAGGVQGPGGVLRYALYQHQLASGTDAGTFTSGSWQTVPLTTEVVDTGNDGAIAANAVTLTAGTYRARWRSVGFQVGRFQSRLLNVTSAAVIGYGTDVISAAADGAQLFSPGEARFTVTAGQVVRIEAQCQTTNAGDGFGQANSFGGTEVYASLELMKEI